MSRKFFTAGVLFIYALMCGSYSLAQKKPQILLVGVIHNIPDSLKCNWKTTYEKLERYKPDQISIEYNLPSDTSSHFQYLGRNYKKIWDSIMVAWEGTRIDPADSIAKYAPIVATSGKPQDRLKLWKYYYLNVDMGNKDYQAYLLEQEKDRYTALLDMNKSWDKNFAARQKAFVNQRKNSEFFNLVFPLARKFNISYLYPSDDKSTYPFQSRAYVGFADALGNTEDWKKYLAFWEEFSAGIKTHQEQCDALEFVNAKEYQEKSDFGQAQILEHLNNADFKAYVEVWYKRNRSIADRIINAVQQSKAERMAVFYGDVHIFPVKKFLEDQGFEVKLLRDLK